MSKGWELHDFQVQEAGILGDVVYLFIFLRFFFFFLGYGPFFKVFIELATVVLLFFCFLAPRHVGSELSTQGLNLYIPSGVEGEIVTTGPPGKPLGGVV